MEPAGHRYEQKGQRRLSRGYPARDKWQKVGYKKRKKDIPDRKKSKHRGSKALGATEE